jgi:hypothetical protein
LGESEYLMSSAVNSSLAAGPLGLAVTVGTRPGALAVGEGDSVGVGASVLVAIGVTVGKGALGGCVEKGEGETWIGGVAGGGSGVWHANAASTNIQATSAMARRKWNT